MKKNKRTEVEQVIEYLEKEGFREIKPEERNLPEFRDSIKETRKLIKEMNSKKKKVKI